MLGAGRPLDHGGGLSATLHPGRLPPSSVLSLEGKPPFGACELPPPALLTPLSSGSGPVASQRFRAGSYNPTGLVPSARAAMRAFRLKQEQEASFTAEMSWWEGSQLRQNGAACSENGWSPAAPVPGLPGGLRAPTPPAVPGHCPFPRLEPYSWGAVPSSRHPMRLTREPCLWDGGEGRAPQAPDTEGAARPSLGPQRASFLGTQRPRGPAHSCPEFEDAS